MKASYQALEKNRSSS